jgi:calcineurin-like phosphoesterase family protein
VSEAWFTSDWHFGHERSLHFAARKGFKKHKDVEDIILDRLWTLLAPGDNLYYLGDLQWHSTKESLDVLFDVFKRRRVNFHWVLGNHDNVPQNYKHRALVSVSVLKDVAIKKQPMTLCHYPMLCWNRSHYDAIQLHGHIHDEDSTHKLMEGIALPPARRLNVNVEFHSWEPWAFEDILLITKNTHNWDLIDDRRSV